MSRGRVLSVILGAMLLGYTLGVVAARQSEVRPAPVAPAEGAADGQIVGPPKPAAPSGARRLADPGRKAVEVHPSDPVLGPHDAPVTLVEFSDFECAFCARASATVKRLQEEYRDRVRFVFKHHPLPMHPNAQPAHEAAAEAHVQGKFWEYKELLFRNNRALGRADLEGYAAALGLDPDRFRQALDDGHHRTMIEENVRQAESLGISGTPAFLINGRLVAGAVPYEQLKRILDEEILLAGRL